MKYLKKLAILYFSLIILIAFTFLTYANTPRWSYLTMISADMEVDDQNHAEIVITCNSDASKVNKIIVKCELQKLDGTWNTIKTWEETTNQYNITYSKKYNISKDYQYRLKVTAKAYKNSKLLETVTEIFD